MSRHALARIVVCLAVVTAIACSGNRTLYRDVRVPPRIDLSEHEIIALIDFDATARGDLGALATRRFADIARRDQGVVRMLAVHPDTDRRDPEALRELGARHGARTLLVGTIEVSDVRPNLSLASTLRSGTLTANVDASLTVDLVETETGASLWSASGSATRTIGHVSVFEGDLFSFDAEDPEQAYGPLIDALVSQVTADLRATWVREAIPQ